MSDPGTDRRRRRGRLVVLLVAIVPMAGLIWAVHWALTATPAGSAGLERDLADVARWEGTGPVADGSAFATWTEVIAEHRRVAAGVAATFPPDGGSYDHLSVLNLASGDDEDPWPSVIEDESSANRAGSGRPRAVLRARAEALRNATLIERLGAVAEGPRPAATADQLASMGFGSRMPYSVYFAELGDARAVARDLLGLAHLDATSGHLARVPDVLLAVEGLARGAEAVPTLLHQMVADAIRHAAWNTVAELAAQGRLDIPTIDALAARMASPAAALPPGIRGERAIDGERTMLRGMLGHLYDEEGRALVSEWAIGGGVPIGGGRLANLAGLFAANRTEVERRLDELAAGSGPSLVLPSGPASILSTDFLPGKLIPVYEQGRQQFARAERLPVVGRVALAVARHAAVHGAPPASLAELELPADATVELGGRDSLGYERIEGADDAGGVRWRVWSTSPNPAKDGDDVVLPARPSS